MSQTIDKTRVSISGIRVRVLAMAAAIWLSGVVAFYYIIRADAATGFFEAVSWSLFAILFGWIAFSFSIAIEGFFGQVRRARGESSVPAGNPILETVITNDAVISNATRNAILVPVYNESPTRVFAAVAAMREQLQSIGEKTDHFDFFILSDSTDPEVWLEEEWCWSELTRMNQPENGIETDEEVGIFYRHRSNNHARKAGNIADFCEKWGVHYDHMIVLDADSLMTGSTMNEMVQRMKSYPQLGILQVPPTPVGRSSLLARLQQFASAVYGPMFAEGFDRFAGDQGNYWGHNAIIRTSAFMRHCHLPVLAGEAPLGGEILSHDFVEAALMVKAGWKVKLANDLGGSFEECPTTLLDFVKRDQRWCQGNLQHFQVMICERIHMISRLHFVSGILSYVAAPLWLMFLTVCVIAAIVNDQSANVTEGPSAVSLMLGLFFVSMMLLVVPKLLAVGTLIANRDEKIRLGGTLGILGSVLVETFASILFAPIVAVYHSRFVISTLIGHNVKWNAQQRDEKGVSWQEASQQMWPLTVAGFALSVGILWIRPAWIGWFSPIVLGWLLSIPVTVAMGSRRVGLKFHQWNLLQISTERTPEPILSRHRHWIAEIEAVRRDDALMHDSLFDRLMSDGGFLQQHLDILRAAGNQVTIRQEDPEWVVRNDQSRDWTRIPTTMRRQLLCDDEWLERVGSHSQRKL